MTESVGRSELLYCHRCGSELSEREIEGRVRKYCSNCSQPVYRNPKAATGVLVVDGSQCLLVKRGVLPDKGTWSLPAGFIEVDEPPEKGAARELGEETGLSVDADELVLRQAEVHHQLHTEYVLLLIYTVSSDKVDGEPAASSDVTATRFWNLDDFTGSDEKIRPGFREYFEETMKAVRTSQGFDNLY